jgi:cytosine/adenosine deaminase-related metal-dependent hydrolase
VLADVVLAKGQRALVGKVSMDQHAPPGTAQTTAQDLAGAAQVVAYVKVG